MEYFHGHDRIEVCLIGCDRPDAGVLKKAWDHGMPILLFTGLQLKQGDVLKELQALRIDLIILAGFLRLIPIQMVRAYEGRIINIHPALLPKYGGKGMYGEKVHAAVIASGDRTSGITIHLVNEHYDEGEHLLQVECPVFTDDSAATLADRIHLLEHRHYAPVVEEYALRHMKR